MFVAVESKLSGYSRAILIVRRGMPTLSFDDKLADILYEVINPRLRIAGP